MSPADPLIGELRRRGRARASDLTEQLRASQPTISRLITAAGDRICRMGAGRAAHYALTRSIPILGTRLSIYRVDERGSIHRYGKLHFLENDHQWLERENGPGRFFAGLPPFAADMRPQGFMGRGFSTRHPELKLPLRLGDWTTDHHLVALALRGEDCPGNLILGDESLNRFLAQPPHSAQPDDYPQLARTLMAGHPGSSAGGEQPKFLTYSEGRHVLVKFSGREGAAAMRWKDLFLCESIALEAVRAEGLPAATARPLSIAGRHFLEVERFDRIDLRGRRALISLGAIDNEYFELLGTWTDAAQRLLSEKFIDPEGARRIRWLDAFGQLIGNTDRHFWNLSFFEDEKGRLQLAPVYDMLPMIFAPVEGELVERRFEPSPPTADNLDVWSHAARCAVAYWGRLAESNELSGEFRERCLQCKAAVEELLGRAPVA